MRFVDLFAGLGGFHVALSRLGHQCVFASEIDRELCQLYVKNFGIEPLGDIRACHDQVPDHDVLCAGFPCQPFSKAGGQLGFDCPESGDLFEFVLYVLKRIRPRFAILENVPNILSHGDRKTFKSIEESLSLLEYQVKVVRLSPHQVGVPQKRERVFILASQTGFPRPFDLPAGKAPAQLRDLLENAPSDAREVSAQHSIYLDHWQKFLDLIPKEANLTAFPIWAMEFGATYPFEGVVPLDQDAASLSSFHGAFGRKLSGLVGTDMVAALPPYARQLSGTFPNWKQSFIRQNRAFFQKYGSSLMDWLETTATFPASFQKLEWNWKGGPRKIDDGLIQFRASGIRVRSPECSSSLVAINASQVPIVGWERRYLSRREGARLQSLSSLKHLPLSHGKAAGALGNAVNADVVHFLAERLIGPALE